MVRNRNQLKELNTSQSTPRQTNKIQMINPDENPDTSLLPKTRSNALKVSKNSAIPSTPLYRSSNSHPPSTQLSSRWTQRNYPRTPVALKRPGSLTKHMSLTPHGRAARRELNLRAGLTPAGYRRKTGQTQQKKTPRDDLRALSRILAAKSQPKIQNPVFPTLMDGNEDEDEEIQLTRPRLSLALRKDDEDEEDDGFLLPPQSTDLEDETLTVKSIELPRRATSDEFPDGLSRGSFGSIRVSDAFTEMSEVRYIDDADESSYMINNKKDNPSYLLPDDHHSIEESETLKFTAEIGAMLLPTGRESDIRRANILTEDNDTFVLTVPSRELVEKKLESNERDHPPDAEVSEFSDNEDLPIDENFNVQESPGLSNNSSDLQDFTAQIDGQLIAKAPRERKRLKLSKYGIAYPSLPVNGVKKLATTFAKTSGIRNPTLNKESIDAIMQATDWFFEQVSDDLSAYAKHAGRKTIDESDVVTLMRRQRQISNTTTPFFLAQRYLPRELLQELRMGPNLKLK